MIRTFNQRLKKLILISIIGFLILFIFRLIHGYTIDTTQNSGQAQFFENISSLRKNYASKAYKMKSNPANPSIIQVDQKYEKIAEVNTKSNKFEQEEKRVRNSIIENDAIIQFEQKNGNKGYRKLNLLIGVPPEKFDTLYSHLIKIGKIQSKQITKKDKTNEYRALTANKTSLEKIRNSLLELKSKGGKIEEYVNLENRILEIEQQLQELGVNLGDFDQENEFCTVKFFLNEGKEKKISLTHRIKVALEWTIKMYFGLMAVLFFISLFSYTFLVTIEKTKILEKILK